MMGAALAPREGELMSIGKLGGLPGIGILSGRGIESGIASPNGWGGNPMFDNFVFKLCCICCLAATNMASISTCEVGFGFRGILGGKLGNLGTLGSGGFAIPIMFGGGVLKLGGSLGGGGIGGS